MGNKIEIYQTPGGKTQIEVKFEEDTVWLNRRQLSTLFDRDVKTIGKHVNNVFKEKELDKKAVVANFATTAADGKTYRVEHYNLDVIISVGYRVKSIRGTQFRIWATQQLKDYLVKGYAINEKRLEQKQQEVRYLKTGIRILERAIGQKADAEGIEWLKQFSTGLELLDDYDHKNLDRTGTKQERVVYPGAEEFLSFISEMYSGFKSDVFAKPKDDSFLSSINQIRQSFDGKELYPTLEEKASTLLYLIVKSTHLLTATNALPQHVFYCF